MAGWAAGKPSDEPLRKGETQSLTDPAHLFRGSITLRVQQIRSVVPCQTVTGLTQLPRSLSFAGSCLIHTVQNVEALDAMSIYTV